MSSDAVNTTALERRDDPGVPAAGSNTLRWLTLGAIVVGFALLSVWLWSRFCRFPTVAWNDMRLAPSVAFSYGLPVYPTATTGTITTWMYGPLPVLYYLPAALAPTAASALQIAAALNFALTLVPLALVCLLWPVPGAVTGMTFGRVVAFLGCLAVWPELHYSVLFSDNLAIAGGLLGNLVLVRATTSRERWVAAAAATAAIACKQICLGIPLAQVLWLLATQGRVSAWRHTVRCAVTGIALAVLLMALFGGRGLWFTLVEIPGGIKWATQPWQRLLEVSPALAVSVGLPAVVMLVARRWFRQPELLLPALTWACALPLGFAALLKLGGWTNSIHSFVLWLPPVLATALVMLTGRTRRPLLVPFAAAVLAAVAFDYRLVTEPDLPLRIRTTDYAIAAELAARHPRAIWFPLHPLVTLYSEHRYYHDEDGLYVRIVAKRPPGEEQLAAGLPPLLQLMAFRSDWTDWGLARGMLPPNSREFNVGHWVVRAGVSAPVAP